MEALIVATVVLLALAVVLAPLLRREKQSAAYGPADLDADVLRYREALRAGTACTRCAEASPPGSRYCMRCGRRLAPATTTANA